MWLSKNPALEPPFSFEAIRLPWSISVRDREGGTLLFGAAWNDFDSPASPVQIGELRPLCTATNVNPYGCTPNASVRYSSVTIRADEPVVVDNGELGRIRLGGVSYDVRLAAQEEILGRVTCADYSPTNGVALDIRATELEDLITTLDVGPPPACGQGNDVDPTIFFGLTEVSTSTTYEGEVTYIGRDPMNAETYQFQVPGLHSFTDTTPMLYLSGAAAILPEPEPGQRLWLSFPGLAAQALRESQHGKVLLAQAFGSAGRDALEELGREIGVPLTQEERCAYTSSSSLWDVVFGTTPPVRVESGTTETVVIDGSPYHAWVWNQGEPRITLYPAN